MKTKIKKKIVLLAMLACIAMISAGLLYLSNTNYAYAHQVSERIEVFSEQRLENSARSVEIAGDVMREFRVEVADRGDEIQTVYDDSFAGIFIDSNGILNIAITQGARSSIVNQFDGQVVLRQFTYSYNHLLQIKDIVFPFMYTHGVFTIAIDEVNNRVSIYITDYIYKNYIIEALQNNNLYTETSLEFIVDPNSGITLHSRAIYGGDRVARYGIGQWSGGTIGTQAICNITGRVGILTNEHVISHTRGDRGYHATNTTTNQFPIGHASRGYFGGYIDAAFVPFENQSAWTPSPHARGFRNPNNINDLEKFTDVRLATEGQIFSGAAIKKIGGYTGISYGYIQSRNASFQFPKLWQGQRRTVRNTFSFCNYGQHGDSGGPVYIRGANGRLYLAGLYIGEQTTGLFVRRTRGYACRMSHIMNDLQVTPITNGMPINALVTGTYNMPPVYRNASNDEIGTNIHIHGNNTRLSVQLTLSNGTTRMLNITGNGTNTTFSTTAAEWSAFNRTLTNANFMRIGFWHDHFTIWAANAEGNPIWHISFSTIPSNLRFTDIRFSISQTDSRNRIFGAAFIPVSNQDQFSAIRNNLHGNFRLMNNITFTGQWTPIPRFYGVLDGNNRAIDRLTITGRTVTSNGQAFGLFAINSGTIRNLSLWSVNIDFRPDHANRWSSVGAVAGVNRGTIQNAQVDGRLEVHRAFSALGGIAGENRGTISHSTFGWSSSGFPSHLQGNGDMGGIAGTNLGGGRIENCLTRNATIYYYWSITNRSIGGIVGNNEHSHISSSQVHHTRISYINPQHYAANSNVRPYIGSIVGRLISSWAGGFGTIGLTVDPGYLHINQQVNFRRVGWGGFGGNWNGANNNSIW